MPLLFYPRLFGDDTAVMGGGGSTPPATPTLSVTPNGDGTATATISGSTGGSTNEIEVAPLGVNGSEAWTNAGSRLGDGTVTLTLANGSYLARCQSTLAGVAALDSSNAYLFSVTGGTPSTTYNSPHAAAAHAVQTKIVSLLGTKIVGVVADSVRCRKVPGAVDYASAVQAGMHQYPGILVVYGDKERDFGGLNDRDDIGYPVLVVFASKDVDGQGRCDLENNDDQYLTWRKVVDDTFRNQPFSVTNYAPLNPLQFQTCMMERGPIVDWARWQKDQIFVGAMTLVFVLRKQRGANPGN